MKAQKIEDRWKRNEDVMKGTIFEHTVKRKHEQITASEKDEKEINLKLNFIFSLFLQLCKKQESFLSKLFHVSIENDRMILRETKDEASPPSEGKKYTLSIERYHHRAIIKMNGKNFASIPYTVEEHYVQSIVNHALNCLVEKAYLSTIKKTQR